MSHTIDVRVRRRPKYSVFMGAGALLGLIAAPLVAAQPVQPINPAEEYSFFATAGFFAALLGTIGLFLGGGVALLVERLTARRERRYTVGAYYQRMSGNAPAPEAAVAGDADGAGNDSAQVTPDPAVQAQDSGAQNGAPAGDPSTGDGPSVPGRPARRADGRDS